MGMMNRLKFWFAQKQGSAAMARVVLPAVMRASLLIGEKKYAEARKVLLEVLDNRARIADLGLAQMVLDSLWVTWFQEEKYAEGVRFLTEYLARYPNEPSALAHRATGYWYTGKLQEAANDFSRALELMPGNSLALSGRGQVWVELGEFDKGLADLDAATQVYQNNPFVHCLAYTRNGRAAALAGLGDFERGMQEFDLSIALCPENAWVYYNRAQAFERAGDHERAIADYRTALEKTGPRLSPTKKEIAQSKLLALVGPSRPN